MKTITVDHQRFGIKADPRTGTPCISSIHPYDETEYHWARQGVTGHSWFIFRDGKRVATIAAPLTEEQIARELLNRDREAHLTRTGGIW